jgi:hypothetical protein
MDAQPPEFKLRDKILYGIVFVATLVDLGVNGRSAPLFILIGIVCGHYWMLCRQKERAQRH